MWRNGWRQHHETASMAAIGWLKRGGGVWRKWLASAGQQYQLCDNVIEAAALSISSKSPLLMLWKKMAKRRKQRFWRRERRLKMASAGVRNEKLCAALKRRSTSERRNRQKEK